METRSPLARKMHLKEGYRAAVLNAPPEYRHMLEPIPDGVQIDEQLNGQYDWIWHFAPSRADLQRDIAGLRASARPNAAIWLSYRKGTPKAPSDLKRETMWEVASTAGLEANSQVAVDETWSALRFKVVE